MSIAKKLLNLREQANISQSKLAKMLYINQQTYSRYETGLTKPTISTLQKMASFYGVPLEYFAEKPYGIKHQTVFSLSDDDIMILKKANEIIDRIINYQVDEDDC